MSMLVYKLQKDLCRCCLAENSVYNMSEPVHNSEQNVEVFSEMLKACFNIELVSLPGDDSEMGICDDCIIRLRNAHSFKQQVLLCEQYFNKKLVEETVITQSQSASSNKQVKESKKCKQIVEEVILFDESDNDQPIIKIKVEKFKKTKAKLLKSNQNIPLVATIRSPTTENKISTIDTGIVESKNETDTNNKHVKGSIWNEFTIVQKADGKYFSCNVCGHLFSKRNHFSQHYKYVHLKKRPSRYHCRLCTETFTALNRMKHMEEVHGFPAPKCTICDKTFRHPFLLVQHQRVKHLGEKNYICTICDQAFGTSRDLRNHIKTHSDDRPFQCSECQKTFKYKRNLKCHMRKHQNINLDI